MKYYLNTHPVQGKLNKLIDPRADTDALIGRIDHRIRLGFNIN
jgi:hypothetical protein